MKQASTDLNSEVFYAKRKLDRLGEDPHRLADGKAGGGGEKPGQEPLLGSAAVRADPKNSLQLHPL